MPFGPTKIFPIDTKPGTAVGVSIPFNAAAVFSSTYTTQEATKNNLINFLVTNPNEIYLNPNFGANLEQFIFQQITSDEISLLKDNIQSLINQYFINVIIRNIEILQYPDTNEINIKIYYSIRDTGLNDELNITFGQ